MLQIDCSQMTFDEQLALASALSDGLAGRAVALVKGDKVVFDEISKVTVDEVLRLTRAFVAGRKDAQLYEVQAKGDEIAVHTPDPLARSRGRKDTGERLPQNLLKCPFCGFVTPYQELYDVHFRSHGFAL